MHRGDAARHLHTWPGDSPSPGCAQKVPGSPELSWPAVSVTDVTTNPLQGSSHGQRPAGVTGQLREVDGHLVEVRRSNRRRRTVSAYEADGRTIVMLPGRLSRADEDRWVVQMLDQLARKQQRQRARSLDSDGRLQARADELSRHYLEGRARPRSVRWVDNQQQRWGSCTPADGTIRLSRRLASMPGYVIDAVLVHELAHLLEAGHGPAFKAWVARYPHEAKAEGFLQGVTFAERQGRQPSGEPGSCGSPPSPGWADSGGCGDSGGSGGPDVLGGSDDACPASLW